jgi:gluconokinase
MEPVDEFPAAVIVMGVSGAGKTTIAGLLAKRLGFEFRDGDWFHPPENVEKMKAGVPLTDDDRWPWLEAISTYIREAHSTGRHVIVACSALRRIYRDVLVGDRGSAVRLVFLKGEKDLVSRRIGSRQEHFMPPALLDSQFATLEEPAQDEQPLVVSIDRHPDRIVEEIISLLGREAGPAAAGCNGSVRDKR